jgi:hypothetical protein
MIVKKEEFSNQGPMSASEYRDRFLQLSRYAPEEVNTDAKRQYHFLRGLVDPCTISWWIIPSPPFSTWSTEQSWLRRNTKRWKIKIARLVDLSPGATIALDSQVIQLSILSRITLRDISSRPSIHLSSNSRGSTLSISSSIARTVNWKEVNSRGRIIKHLVFLPQQPTRAVKQP